MYNPFSHIDTMLKTILPCYWWEWIVSYSLTSILKFSTETNEWSSILISYIGWMKGIWFWGDLRWWWWIVNGGSPKLLSWSLARGWLHPCRVKRSISFWGATLWTHILQHICWIFKIGEKQMYSSVNCCYPEDTWEKHTLSIVWPVLKVWW